MWKIIVLMCYLAHSVMSLTIKQINAPLITYAIAPIWDEPSQSLFFANLNPTGREKSIFRYVPDDNALYSAHVEGLKSLAFVLPIESNNHRRNTHLFFVGAGSETFIIKWNGKSKRATIVKKLFGLDKNIPFSSTGLGKNSPTGTFYGGTYYPNLECTGPAKLSFYRYDERGLVRFFGGLKSTSGIAFAINPFKIYHLDSCQLVITELDKENGFIRRVVFDFRKFNEFLIDQVNFPLGLEIDTNGFLYTVQPHSIWVIDPRTSTLVKTINFPLTAPVLNGVAFGGRQKDILYVIAGSYYDNPFTEQTIAEYTRANGTSLYQVTGLHATGISHERLKIN